MRAAGEVNARARRVAKVGRRALAALTPASLVATLVVRPGVLDNYRAHPVGVALPLAVAASLVAMEVAGRLERERAAFAASTAYLVAMLGGAAFALYPVLLPASGDLARSLTIATAATGSYAMRVALAWWVLAFVLVAAAFTYLYRSFRGKVVEGADGDEYH
jgi:cytochrome d ubiquinol oxidase subunit II